MMHIFIQVIKCYTKSFWVFHDLSLLVEGLVGLRTSGSVDSSARAGLPRPLLAVCYNYVVIVISTWSMSRSE